MKEQEPSTWKELLSHEDVTGTFLSGFGSISVGEKHENCTIVKDSRVSRGRNFFSEAISENENKTEIENEARSSD